MLTNEKFSGNRHQITSPVYSSFIVFIFFNPLEESNASAW